MAKTYSLEALWPLLKFRKPEPPLLAIAESGSVNYVANTVGIWLVADLKGLTDQETQALTGLHPAKLGSKKIEGVNGYAYGMHDGTPLLPLPFTAAELTAFEERTPGVISENIMRGDETDVWITNLKKDNPDAAELARGIYGGQWPSDFVDVVETDGDANQISMPTTATPAVRPTQRSAAQDAAILATINSLSVDPLAIPKNEPGKPGIKAKVRTALKDNSLFTGSTVFKKSWERLTSRGEIVIRA